MPGHPALPIVDADAPRRPTRRVRAGVVLAAMVLVAVVAVAAWKAVGRHAVESSGGSDTSEAWTSLGPGGAHVRALAEDVHAAGSLYAATSDRGLIRYDPAASSWHVIPVVPGARPDIHTFALDPRSAGTIYAGTGDGRLFKSTDAGATWIDTKIPGAEAHRAVLAVAIDPADPSRIYAGTAGAILAVSTTAGATWTRREHVVEDGTDVSALLVDPTTPGAVYVGTAGSGVVHSSESGVASEPMVMGLAKVTVAALALDTGTPPVLYAATTGGGVFTASPGGRWEASGAGLTTAVIWSLAVDPARSGTVYAGGSGGALFKSTDRGRHWEPLSAGLMDSVLALAIDGGAPALYLGTNGRGVYRGRLER